MHFKSENVNRREFHFKRARDDHKLHIYLLWGQKNWNKGWNISIIVSWTDQTRCNLFQTFSIVNLQFQMHLVTFWPLLWPWGNITLLLCESENISSGIIYICWYK